MSCSVKIKALDRLKEDGVISSSRDILNYNEFNRLNELYTETAVNKYGLNAGNDFLFSMETITNTLSAGSSYRRDNKITKFKAVPNDILFNELEQLVINERSLEKQEDVNFTLKSVEILSSDNGKKVFEKGRKHKWSLDKILTELQIPKFQKEIILDKEVSNREDIVTSLLADNTYSVELQNNSTNRYEQTTIEGGVNYQETDIRTPDIIPSIEAHASFTSPESIGWFRSDEQPSSEENSDNKTRRVLEIQSTLFQARESQDAILVNDSTTNELREKIIEELSSSLSINEVSTSFSFNEGDNSYTVYKKDEQWFIRGRKRSAADRLNSEETNVSINGAIVKNHFVNHKQKRKVDKLVKDRADKIENRSAKETSQQNDFLQILNLNDNWSKFFIQSIVQDSVNKGYNKVLFPTGSTTSKIQETDESSGFYDTKVKSTLKKFYNITEHTDQNGNTWIEVDLVAEKIKGNKFEILLKELNDSKRESPGSEYLYTQKESKAIRSANTSQTTRDENADRIAELFGGDFINITANEFLRNALYSLDLNDTTKELVKKLLISRAKIKFVSNLKNDNTVAQYDPATRTISLNQDKLVLGNDYYAFETVLHEIAHDMTVNALNNPKNDEQRAFRGDMTALYNYFKSKSSSNLYGFRDVNEFVAEIFSNPIFREEIDNIPMDGTTQSILSKFLDFITNLFGISSLRNSDIIVNEILRIGMIEYDSNVTYASESNFILEKQEELPTTKEKYRPEFTEQLQSLDDIISNVVSQMNAVANKSAYKRGKRDDNTKRFVEASKLVNKLADFSTTEAIYKYVEFANKELFKLNRSLQNKIKNNVKLTSDYLYRAESYVSIYSSLSDIKDMLNVQFGKGLISETEYNKINRQLSQASENYQNFNSMYINQSKEQLVDKLWKVNTKPWDVRRIALEKEWNNTKPSTNKTQWVNDQLAEERDSLEMEAREMTRELLDNIPFDLQTIEANIMSEKNLPNLLLKMYSAVLDGADLEVRDHTMKLRYNMKRELDNFNPTGSTNQEKFGKLVEQDGEGNYYFIGEYKAEFNRKFNELVRARFDMEEKHGKSSIEYRKANATYQQWVNENIIKDEFGQYKLPSKKWLNPNYKNLSKAELYYLDHLKYEIKQADSDTMSYKSLITEITNKNFIKLPSIRQSDLDRILSGDIKGLAKDKLEDLKGKVQQDRTEGGELVELEDQTDDQFVKTLSTINNQERFLVPIHYRAKLDPKDQSLDLPTIVLMNSVMSKEFSVKQALEADANLLIDVVGKSNVYKTQPVTRKPLISAFSSDMIKPDLIRIPGVDSNLHKKLIHVTQNRIYNITDASAGKMTGDKVNIITQNILGYTAHMTLAVNWMSAIPNMFQGKFQNWFEAVGYDTYNRKDLIWAEKTYWNEMMNKGGLKDIGSPVNNNKLNLMIDRFNVLTDFSAVKHDFEKDNKFKALFTVNSLHAFNSMGEHYAQSTLMLAVMSNIKVMNDKGQYLDSNGNVVEDKKLAMNFYEAFNIVEGQLVLKDGVKRSSFNPELELTNNIAIVQIENLVKKKVIDLHGQYNSKIQSTLQRYWFGKAITMFRKWLLPGFYRRWRGSAYVFLDVGDVIKGKRKNIRAYDELHENQQNYSLEERQFTEGTYASFLRFIIRSVLPGLKQFKLETATADWNNLSDHEKGNVHKVLKEVIMALLMMTGAMMIAAAAEDEPDDELRKYLYVLAYMFKRQEAELMQYYSINDSLRIFRTPFAALNTIEKSVGFLTQVMPWNIDETYEKGRNADEFKAWVKLKRLVPVISQTERDAQKSYNFLENSTSY